MYPTMDENRDAEPVEELEAIGEAEAFGRESGPEEPAPGRAVFGLQQVMIELLEEPALQTLTRSYETVIVPMILLDRDLCIIWANNQFQDLYGDMADFAAQSIITFFESSFDPESQGELHRQLLSANNHSWRRQVERRGRDDLSVTANLLILPVYKTAEEKADPLSYMVVLDNVSTEQNKLLRDIYKSLLEASRLKDNDTGNHVSRINSYACRLAEIMQGQPGYQDIDRQFIENISYLSSMHDVGKIGTSDNILNKEGPLEEWEWEIMKEHTINGAFLLSSHPIPMSKEIALFHHEKWNGSGYPYGVSREMIPLSARIVALADVYDALRMSRPYKDAHSHDKSLDIMMEGKGVHFDPLLLDNFRDINEEFDSLYEGLKD
jgi:HD-GYP domain-containing protein (c-di-GMP phosphodiesterase class II)